MADKAGQNAWVSRVLGFSLSQARPPDDDGVDLPDDAEEAGSMFQDVEQYAQYLRKRLAQLRSKGQGTFGMVAGSQPDEHRLALHPARKPQSLSALLIKETGLHKSTWGICAPHPDRPGTIQVGLEGRQLPGLKKKAEQMLRAFAPQPFTRVALMVDGQEVDDLDDPDDEDPGQVPEALRGLPSRPGPATSQTRAFTDAALAGAPFCEECAAKERT